MRYSYLIKMQMAYNAWHSKMATVTSCKNVQNNHLLLSSMSARHELKKFKFPFVISRHIAEISERFGLSQIQCG